MNGKKKRFSIGLKVYIFVILTVLTAVLGTALLSYQINSQNIDKYFKRLAYNSAENFAALSDGDFLARLKANVMTDEYTQLRNKAEENDDEGMIKDWLKEKGLWDDYSLTRNNLCTYVRNMTDIKYLYIMVLMEESALYDMYLLDEDDLPLYQTGLYEVREQEFYGMDSTTYIEPVISNGDWGWLCSAFAPVYTSDGSLVCHIGCDVDMEDVMHERLLFFTYILTGAVIFTIMVLVVAIFFANRVIVRPLNRLTAETVKFKPSGDISYKDAGVIQLNIKSHDEIRELHDAIRMMQINIVEYLNDLRMMYQDNQRYASSLQKAENDIKDKNEQIGQISKEAYHDSLTGVGNKTAYDKKIEELSERIANTSEQLSIAIADLNDLKKINDIYGHKSGDLYIAGSCHLICDVFKHSPVYRIGGDEFVILLQGVDHENRYELVAKLKKLFEESRSDIENDPWLRYSAAVGMAERTPGDTNAETVFKRADKAMYEDKLKYKKKYGSYR